VGEHRVEPERPRDNAAFDEAADALEEVATNNAAGAHDARDG